MKAMIIRRISRIEENPTPLEPVILPDPVPGNNEILVRVSACGVCHTELDEIEGRTPPPKFPVVPGHQVVGRVEKNGDGASRFKNGDRVGVAWIFSACGTCPHCLEGKENLCPDFRATGRDANGGYAGYMTVTEDFAHFIPDIFTDAEAAPLLCAGAVGYRSLMLTGLKDGSSLGLTGFGASGHLVIKMVRHLYPGARVYVFARSEEERRFARDLGAVWAGNHRRDITGKTGRHHRYHTGMETGGGSHEKPQTRRTACHQRHTEGRDRQGISSEVGLPFPPVDGKGDQERG